MKQNEQPLADSQAQLINGTSEEPIVIRGAFISQLSATVAELLASKQRQTIFFFRNASGSIFGRLSVSERSAMITVCKTKRKAPLWMTRLLGWEVQDENPATTPVQITQQECDKETIEAKLKKAWPR